MAKECVKARQVKRERLIEQYAARRAELKKAGDYVGLSKLP
ncbi:MAG TPA: 30S ribosomal protein S14, partial [Bacteroidia bacterium]|nr:30S ribosomal protein S14 [Bacteroidia bacterium]